MSFLANRIRSNIRRLEGALTRVVSYAALTSTKLSLELVESLLRDILQEEGRHAISIEVIQKRVAEHFDIRLADMSSKRRPENIAFPRQIAMFLSRQMTEGSLSAIGEAFWRSRPRTVFHACRLVKDRMEVDSHVRGVVGTWRRNSHAESHGDSSLKATLKIGKNGNRPQFLAALDDALGQHATD